MTEQEVIWTLENVEKVAEDTKTLTLKPKREKPAYRAGQYIEVKLPGFNPLEGKPYSISSAPHEEFVKLTIKVAGEYSQRLTSKNIGEEVISSEPYGFFFLDEPTEHLVCIAGGIGITPFRALILEQLEQNPDQRISLYVSYRTEKEVVFNDEFEELMKKHPNFKVFTYITREPNSKNFEKGRFSIDQIVDSVPNLSETDFLICGAIKFTREIWKELSEKGIEQEKVYTEAFF